MSQDKKEDVVEGIIDSRIVEKVKDITRDRRRAKKVQNMLEQTEPTLMEWIDDSTRVDITEIIRSGIQVPGQQTFDKIGSILVQAKIEGYLMATLSQDHFWCNKYGIRDTKGLNKEESRLKAFEEGKLEDSYYEQLEKKLTEEDLKTNIKLEAKVVNTWIKRKDEEKNKNELKETLKVLNKPKEEKAAQVTTGTGASGNIPAGAIDLDS